MAEVEISILFMVISGFAAGGIGICAGIGRYVSKRKEQGRLPGIFQKHTR